MKLSVVLSNRFQKDLKLISKRGYDLDLLKSWPAGFPWKKNTEITR